MRLFATRLGAALVAGFLVVGTLARADEEKVPLDKVPKAVMDAVKAKFPGAQIQNAATEKEEGKTVYELSLMYQKHHYDVTLTPEGMITDVEKEIDATNLPKAVAQVLETKYPKATYKRVEELSKGNEKVTAYEVLLVTTGKKTFEVELDPKGKIIKETEQKAKE